MGGETVVSVELSTFLISIFGIVNLVILGPAVWILKSVIADLRSLQKEHGELKDEVHTKYVHKEDYGRDIKELKDMVRGLYDKLDSKADKASA